MSDNLRVFNFSKQNEAKPPFIEKINRGGWVDMGEDNLYPQFLLELLDKSGKHASILKGKSQMIGGNGFIKSVLSQEAISFIKNPYNEFDLEEILARVSFDLELFGGYFLNIIWSQDKQSISEIGYLDPVTVRVAAPDPENDYPDLEYYYVCDDWTNTRKNPPIKYQGFSTTRKKEASQILYVKDYRPGEVVYSRPEYVSATNWIELEYEISRFHLQQVRQGFAPSLLINFASGIPTDEEMDTIIKRLRKEYEGSEQAGKVIFTFSDGTDKAPTITPIQLNDSDDRFKDLNKSVEDAIYQSHRITNPALFGVKVAGELGTQNDLIESLNIFQGMYITPKQRQLERVFNRLAKINGITDKLTIEKYSVKLEVKLSVADILSILTSTLPDPQKSLVLQSSGYTKDQADNLVKAGIVALPTNENNSIS